MILTLRALVRILHLKLEETWSNMVPLVAKLMASFKSLTLPLAVLGQSDFFLSRDNRSMRLEQLQ